MDRIDLLNALLENYQSIHRSMTRSHDYQHEGIPLGQKAALLCIAMHESLHVKQLAALLHVTSGAATQHVESLVQEGLVSRTADEGDRRTVAVALTEAGEALIKKMRENRMNVLVKLFSGISDEELKTYVAVTQKVARSVEEKGE